jgi:hypothetical protein
VRKVPKLTGEAATDLDLVIKGLRVASSKEVIGEGSLDVLLAILPFSTAGGGLGERHRFQEEVIGLAKTPLERAASILAGIRTEAAACAEQEKKEMEKVDAVRDGAAAAASAARALAAERLNEQQKADAAVAAAKREQVKTEALSKPMVDKHAEAQRADAELKAIAEMTAELVEGDGEKPTTRERHELTSRLVEFLGKLGLEKALLAAIPGAVRKESAKRGRFDKVTVESLQAAIVEQRHCSVKNIEVAAEAMKESDCLALGMWAIFEDEKERAAATAEMRMAAEKAVGDAEQSERAAQEKAASAASSFSELLLLDVKAEEAVKQACQALEAHTRLTTGKVESSPLGA